jgi:predicted flap endonuclease-1-like 5' DNA nuclease
VVQPSGALETFSAVLVSLRPAKELPVALSVGEKEVIVVAGDRPLDRGPLARSEIRRAGTNEFLLLIEGRGWQIRVDNVAAFTRDVLPRFGQGRFNRLRAWRVSWFGLRNPSDGTLRVTPWAVVTSLAWVVVLVMGIGIGRLDPGVARVLAGAAVAGVALLGLGWARLTPRTQRKTSPAALNLRPVAPEPVAHSAVNVGMAGDVDLVREILGDRISGRQKFVPMATPSTARAAGSIPAPPTTNAVPVPAVEVETSGVAEAVSNPPQVGGSGLREPEPDDLTAIRGIGPRLAARLAKVGVVTFRQLAELGESEIVRLQAELGTFVHRMEKDRWQEQAREAHARKYGGDPSARGGDLYHLPPNLSLRPDLLDEDE